MKSEMLLSVVHSLTYAVNEMAEAVANMGEPTDPSLLPTAPTVNALGESAEGLAAMTASRDVLKDRVSTLESELSKQIAAHSQEMSDMHDLLKDHENEIERLANSAAAPIDLPKVTIRRAEKYDNGSLEVTSLRLGSKQFGLKTAMSEGPQLRKMLIDVFKGAGYSVNTVEEAVG